MAERDDSGINIPFLFFLSGISGLIYETVWFRMLIRVFGTTMEATSTALAVFMGGLALGAWLAGLISDKIKNPLKCYAWIELSVGLLAAAATVLMTGLPEFMAGLLPSGAGFGAALGRGLLRLAAAGVVLLPPTILMGATLPLLTGFLSRDPGEAGGKLSKLYALNTFGAAAGVLACGFLLIGHLGERASVWTAAALNILIAIRVFAWRPGEVAAPPPGPRAEPSPEAQSGYRELALILALSGFAALGLEVLWTRLLVLAMGNSVYAFSAMLGVYLIGIALGSRYAESRQPAAPFESLAKAQALVSALALAGLVVYWAVGRTTVDVKYLYTPLTQASDLLAMFGWAALIIFPVTFVMGYFFPVAVAAGVKLSGRVGGGVGSLYAANTLGAITGALVVGFIMIPVIGTKFTFIFVSILIALTGAMLAWMGGEETKRRFGAWMALPVAAALAAFLLPDPVFSIIEARIMRNRPGDILFHAEDKAGAVTVCSADNGINQYLCINGFVVSGNGPAGRLMAHFPLLFQEDPKEMFVIGLGAGGALRSGIMHGVHVDVAELVASVAETGPIFTPAHIWNELLKRGKFRVILNDGRNELLRTKKIYDAIVVDVTPPIYSSGAVNVYSRDFFRLARKRLSAGGILSLWIPKPCFESDYFMILKSLKAEFPHVNVWSFPKNPGYLALASNNELDMAFKAPETGTLKGRVRPDAVVKALEARITRGRVRLDIPEISAEFIAAHRIMTTANVAADTKFYPEVTDDKPYTEFPLARFLAYSPVWR